MCPRSFFAQAFVRRHNATRCGFSHSFCLTNADLYTNQILYASAILLVCASAFAETPEALVKQALQRNPELNFFVAEIAAAKGAVRTAGTLRNPELSTELGYKNSRENSGGANGDGAIVALSFSQTFEYPGRIALRKAIANHDRVVAELHLQQFRLTLAARVRSLAYALSSADERTKAVQEVTARTQALNDVLKQRPLAGVAPQLEARIISANLLTFQRQERESALAEKTIAVELNQLCGRSADAHANSKREPDRFHRSLRAELGGGGPFKFVRHSHSTGRARSAGLQSRLVEERAVSGHSCGAVLLAGKCNRSRAAIRTRDLVAAAAVGPQRREHCE